MFSIRTHHEAAFGESKFARIKVRIVHELCSEFPEYSEAQIDSTVEHHAETTYAYGFRTGHQLKGCLRLILVMTRVATNVALVEEASAQLWNTQVAPDDRLIKVESMLGQSHG